MNSKTKYIANFYLADNGLLLSAEVCCGVVVQEINSETVEFKCIIQGQEERIEIPKRNLLDSEEQAEKKIESAMAWKEKNILSKRVDGNDNFLPDAISIPREVKSSGNPLRFGEPMICFGAHSNTWGKDDNPQKVLQVAGAICEDIEVLKKILFVLGFANNYSKKLIGKYIIIEINSLYACFKRLSEFDENYKNKYFEPFTSRIHKLENKYRYKTIRNKVAAHRDTNIDMITTMEFWQNITRYTINKYIAIFNEHLEKILLLYPDEAKLYYYTRNKTLKGAIEIENNEEYCAFDEPFKTE